MFVCYIFILCYSLHFWPRAFSLRLFLFLMDAWFLQKNKKIFHFIFVDWWNSRIFLKYSWRIFFNFFAFKTVLKVCVTRMHFTWKNDQSYFENCIRIAIWDKAMSLTRKNCYTLRSITILIIRLTDFKSISHKSILSLHFIFT